MVDDGLIKDISGAFLVLSPGYGRGHQSLGLTGDSSAVPVSEGDITGVAEATQACNAMNQTKWNVALGHQVLQSVDGADGRFVFQGWKRIHFGPEADGIAQIAFGDET